MAQCCDITLQFQGSGARSWVEHPGGADLSRTKHSEASEVIGSVEQGDGDAKPKFQMPSMVGKHNSIETKSKALALQCGE